MVTLRQLPLPRSIRVDVVRDDSKGGRCDEGFLRVRRLALVNTYDDGTKSEVYPYDVVERDAIDAVGIVLVAEEDTTTSICLRTALRPPLALRAGYRVPERDDSALPVLWEIPAGLIEPSEATPAGLRACAARETLEEVGLALAPADFEPFGPALFLSPGMVAEKIHFLCARVDPARCGVPTEDGSPVERNAQIAFVPLDEALDAARGGRVRDIKTEVAIRRLAELRSA